MRSEQSERSPELVEGYTTEKDNSVLGIVAAAKNKLKSAGIVSYDCEAELLLCHLLNSTKLDLYTSDLVVSEHEKTQFEDLLNERIGGMPMQYLMGKIEFFGLPFFISPGVLIPRPETEILVQAVIGLLSASAKEGVSRINPYRILDLCTGSGNIAISLAKHAKYAKITAIDIDDVCLNIARKNAVVNEINNIEFIKSNLFSKLGPNDKFDIIVSNPPYIKQSDLKRLPLEVKSEPIIALDGGEDGFDFYRKIISEARKFLKPGGFLALESGDGQAYNIKEILEEENRFSSIKIINDYNNIPRVVIGVRT